MLIKFLKPIKLLTLPTILLGLTACADAQTALSDQENGGYEAQLIYSGLNAPWGADFLSETELLVTEKNGGLKLILFNSDSLDSTDTTTTTTTTTAQTITIAKVPEINSIGQGGFLDVKKSPNFTLDQTIYFTYADKASLAYRLKLAKAQLIDKRLVRNWEVLFESNQPSDGRTHFGSRIAFDDNGHLYFSMGDRGDRTNAQDLSIHSGSIFRLNLDGSIPDDNPFVNQSGAQPEIWSYGHRNPQGLFFDKQSKQLWSNEHGPRGGDEINLIEKGANYGWPAIGYGREYVSRLPANEATHRDGMQQPIKQFTPSIAPSSLLIYSGKKYDDLAGILFSSALKLRHLNVIQLSGDLDEKTNLPSVLMERRWFEDLSERVRNVIESPTGELLFITDSGDIYKLKKRSD